MAAGAYFPKYGGMLVLTLPDWYGAGTVPVFNANTSCSSPNLFVD
jgi:hypothetical protein